MVRSSYGPRQEAGGNLCAMNMLIPSPQTAPAITLTAARLALEQATDLPTVASLVDRLEVIRVAARKARQSLDAQNDWAVLKLEAERKAGRMLADLRGRGGLRAGRPNADMPSALSELGISQQQSSRWQRLAAVPDERFSQWLAETRALDNEVTEAGLFALAVRATPGDFAGAPFIPPAPAPRADVPRNVLVEGDCLPYLRTLPDNSVDALVTDPPAAISFMGALWDSDRGGRAAWVAWMTDVMRECHRVLKPGAHGLVWALPRTSHWTAWALEDAGFEIVDQVLHIFAQGFPKSHDLSKDLDRRAGAAREVVEVNPNSRPRSTKQNTLYELGMVGKTGYRTAPATDAAKEWEGFGTALKPAHEIWWLVRKAPEGPVALNALRWGTGALNIDACRIPFAGPADFDETANKNDHADFGTRPGGNKVYGDYSMVPRTNYRDRVRARTDVPRAGSRTATFGSIGEPTTSGGDGSGGWQADTTGRWPSNVVLTSSETCLCVLDEDAPAGIREAIAAYYSSLQLSDRAGGREREIAVPLDLIPEGWRRYFRFSHVAKLPEVFDGAFPDEVVGGGHSINKGHAPKVDHGHGAFSKESGGGGLSGVERETDKYFELGGKSRYFLLPKASKRDRDGDVNGDPIGVPEQRWIQYQTGHGKSGRPSNISAGRDTRYRNTLETVKPRALMEHLVRLVTPKGGLVLDPFAGSGTTGIACVIVGCDFLLIEQDLDTADIARARLAPTLRD